MNKFLAKSIGNQYYRDIDVFHADPVVNQVDMNAEYFGIKDNHVVMMIPVECEDFDPQNDVLYEIDGKTYRIVYTNSREELDEMFDDIQFLKMLQNYLNKRYGVEFKIEDSLSTLSLVFENNKIRLVTGVSQFTEHLRSYPTEKVYVFDELNKKNQSGRGCNLTSLKELVEYFDEVLKRKEIEQDTLF